MSIQFVKKQLELFLTSNAADALCLRGKWGVGKTHQFLASVNSARSYPSSICYKRFSYVSLFGINTMDDLKQSIFANTKPLCEKTLFADMDSLKTLSAEVGLRKLAPLARILPYGDKLSNNVSGLISYFAISDQIICFDDLERKSAKLEIGDVLGLASYLKERRNCKIIIILNDEQLKEKPDFERYLEKVVDISLVYAPTANEAADIALPEQDRISVLIRNGCETLSISNVRVIRKIARVVQDIQSILTNIDNELFEKIILSLILFVWSNLQPDEAPPKSLLMGRTEASYYREATDQINGKAKNENAREGAWNALLDAYGYTVTDDTEIELMKGVENGYFDAPNLKRHVQKRQDLLDADRGGNSLRDAWRHYRDSFDDNENEVIDAIIQASKTHVQFLDAANLNHTVILLKQLKRDDQAKELIDFYMANRNKEREFYDLKQHAFYEKIKDKDVINAFAKRYGEVEEKRDIADMLIKLRRSWNEETLAILSSVPVEEYIKIFKLEKGKRLENILAGALQFGKFSNASAQQQEISARAFAALRSIGGESPINTSRVERYGVSVKTISS